MLNVYDWITSTLPISLFLFLALPLLQLQLLTLVHIRNILSRYLPTVHINLRHQQHHHHPQRILLYQIHIVLRSVVNQDLIHEAPQLTHRPLPSQAFSSSQTGMQ